MPYTYICLTFSSFKLNKNLLPLNWRTLCVADAGADASADAGAGCGGGGAAAAAADAEPAADAAGGSRST